MTESVDTVVEEDAGEAEIKPARNWKKLGLYAGGATLVVLLGVGSFVAVLMMRPKTPARVPVKVPVHEVRITPPVVVPKKVEATGNEDDRNALQAEIVMLQAKKLSLLRERAELERQKKYGVGGQSLSGEKKCTLSGDPDKRKQELRACFGLAALSPETTLPHGAAVSVNKEAKTQTSVAATKETAKTGKSAATPEVKALAPSAKTGTLSSLQSQLMDKKLPGLHTQQASHVSAVPAKKPATAAH